MMMVKHLLTSMLLVIAVALPTTTLAWNNWDGGGSDKYNQGTGTVWTDPLNWENDTLPTNEYYTEEARIDEGAMPIIADGNNTTWDRCRIKNGSTITQTGGTHRWNNYTSSYGLAIFNYHWPGWETGAPEPDPSKLHMTGGTHYAERVVLGDSLYHDPEYPDIRGVGIINIWGNSTFIVEPNTFPDPGNPVYQIYSLEIMDNSFIDIRDDGQLRVPADAEMITKTDNYISNGKIVGIDDVRPLVTITVSDEYIISLAIPGDFDLDGDVDVSDLGILATNYGTPNGMAWEYGDATGDEAVDVSDLGILATNYGVSLAVATIAVPEPTVFYQVLGAMLFVFLFRSRSCFAK